LKLRYPAPLLVPAALILTAGLPACARSTDARIEAAAKSSYNFQTLLKDDDVSVHAQDGEVTLQGRVCDRYHKSLAEATVAGIPGVKKVTNNLELHGQQAEESSDAWLTTKVKGALLLHRKVSGLATEVETRAGKVTVEGEAANHAEKDLVTELVKDVNGVQGLTNRMTVRN